MASAPPIDANPLIVFVHTPKTGGSTINRMLANQFPNGIDHCEHYVDRKRHLSRSLETADWISGHMQFRALHDLLAETTTRPLRFFASVRDPVDQVASHYNWLIHIYHQSRLRYLRHSAHSRRVSRKLRQTDNTDPAAIIANLTAHPGLFRNNQYRTITDRNSRGQNGSLQALLEGYEAIMPAERSADLLQAMTGNPPKTAERENQSPYSFDKSLFRSAPVLEFLQDWNSRDFALYHHITSRPRKST
ncbi:MAG: hypothetical protein LJE68_14115 [Rhodobacter sp.]|nr:hypothetical protein [Rhodobacter sp.]